MEVDGYTEGIGIHPHQGNGLAQDILDGYDFASRVAQAADIPLRFITVPAALLTRIDKRSIQCPMLAVKRHLVTPWMKAEGIGSSR